MEKTDLLTHLNGGSAGVGALRGIVQNESALSGKKFDGLVLFKLMGLCFFLQGYTWLKRSLTAAFTHRETKWPPVAVLWRCVVLSMFIYMLFYDWSVIS